MSDVQTVSGSGSRMRRRVLWFFATVLFFPVLAGIYLMSAPPQSQAGSNYKNVDLALIVGTPLDLEGMANGDIPGNLRSLDGKLIAIEGEMLVPDGGKLAPNEFLLIDRPTNPAGSVKSAWQYVLVRMPAEKRVQPIVAPMEMFGRFHAHVRRDAGGRVSSIYELDADWMLVR